MLWRRMSGPDRRHAVSVARETARLLSPGPVPREVVAAALLHDVGKVESRLGTFARVGVTLVAMVAGRDRLLRWSGAPSAGQGPQEPSGQAPAGRPPTPPSPSWRARTGMYLTHDRLGADLLLQAGSAQLTWSWAREHHMPPARWTVDSRVGDALKAADGD